MQLSNESIKKFQKLLEEHVAREVPWEEAAEGARDLLSFYKLLFDLHKVDLKRQERLKLEPKGFHLEGESYTCFICSDTVSNEDTWYDKWGIKCMTCQKAIDKHVIPASIAKDKDGWYAMWEFEKHFGLRAQTVRKLVRLGKLKSRIIPGEAGGNHCEVFLLKDNPGALPPKPRSHSKQVGERSYAVEYEEVQMPEEWRTALKT